MTTGAPTPSVPISDEDGERDRLIARADPGLGDRRRRGDGQQQVLRVHAGEQRRRARAPSTGVKLSIVVIHFGALASSPRWRPAPLLERERQQQQAEHELEHADPGRGLAVIGRRRCRWRRAARPRRRPSAPRASRAGRPAPLERARGVASISTTAMIGNGLMAATTAKARTSPMASFMAGDPAARAGGSASPSPHEARSPACLADCRHDRSAPTRPEAEPCSRRCAATTGPGCAAT